MKLSGRYAQYPFHALQPFVIGIGEGVVQNYGGLLALVRQQISERQPDKHSDLLSRPRA